MKDFSRRYIFTNMKMLLPLLMFCGLVFLWTACRSGKKLPVVASVDLNRYQGRWYEIASIPLRFSRYCACTFAEYTPSADGRILVYNQCRNTKTGGTDSISGKAFPVKGSNNAILKVQFFWPFRGDYYIIDLDSQYTHAMVGSPDRNTLWILSRTPALPESVYAACTEKAAALGFDITRLRRTAQDCHRDK